MPDYKKMYSVLFHAVTAAIDQLQDAQQKVEEIYLESEGSSLLVLPPAAEKKPEDAE